jgi:FlaA1/EpsC-like NDP-sugar epimerase
LFVAATFRQILIDAALVFASWWIAFWLRFNLDIPGEFVFLAWVSGLVVVVVYAVCLSVMRVYRHVWIYIGLPELRQLGAGVLLGGVLSAAVLLMLRFDPFPRSVLLLHPLVTLLMLGAVRAAWRTFSEHTTQPAGARPLLILGSLRDAAEALRTLKGSGHWYAAGIVSPVPSDYGRSLQGVGVLGTVDELPAIAHAVGVHTALMAIAPGAVGRRDVLLQSAGAGLSLITLPRADDWLRHDGTHPRKVELEDLLGRDPVQLDVKGLSELLSGQTVLVTGAGGSIGSELCRQIARFGVARLVCVDVSEYAIYQLEQELRAAHPQMRGLYYTANVRELARLEAIAQAQKPSVVFHAAAYKHVPLMEDLNEIEALRTNVLGTLHAARVAGQCGARRFVMISTDKAVNPTNVMGATKRMAELVVQGVAAEFTATQYVSVRFGNVLGSSGSVVPLFTAQIARGGPLTVTHPDIVRYFMTIPEAAQLVLQAGLMGRSGQIFVLDMGEPVKIVELARMLIRLSGKTEQDVPIAFTGLRPGEKLYEELLASDETTAPTPHPKLRIARTSGEQTVVAAEVVQWIESAGSAPDSRCLRLWLQQQVPEYTFKA